MKNTTLILLFIVLAACNSTPNISDVTTPNVTVVQTNTIVIPTVTASPIPLSSAPVVLTLDSTSDQIQQAMRESAQNWQSIMIDAIRTDYFSNGVVNELHEKLWIDQPNIRFRSIISNGNDPEGILQVFNGGEDVFSIDMKSGDTFSKPFSDEGRVPHYVPSSDPSQFMPNPFSVQINTPVSELVFSSNFAGCGNYKVLQAETIAGRNVVVVEWTAIDPDPDPTLSRTWLDTQTAVILKRQVFWKDSGNLQYEYVVNQVDYDQILEPSLFEKP